MHNASTTRFKRILIFFSIYAWWLGLIVLWTFAAFQAQNLILYLGLLVIQTPSIRPPGWNNDTLVGINKCGFLILGSLWLGLAIFTEKYLREGACEERLLQNALRL